MTSDHRTGRPPGQVMARTARDLILSRSGPSTEAADTADPHAPDGTDAGADAAARRGTDRAPAPYPAAAGGPRADVPGSTNGPVTSGPTPLHAEQRGDGRTRSSVSAPSPGSGAPVAARVSSVEATAGSGESRPGSAPPGPDAVGPADGVDAGAASPRSATGALLVVRNGSGPGGPPAAPVAGESAADAPVPSTGPPTSGSPRSGGEEAGGRRTRSGPRASLSGCVPSAGAAAALDEGRGTAAPIEVSDAGACFDLSASLQSARPVIPAGPAIRSGTGPGAPSVPPEVAPSGAKYGGDRASSDPGGDLTEGTSGSEAGPIGAERQGDAVLLGAGDAHAPDRANIGMEGNEFGAGVRQAARSSTDPTGPAADSSRSTNASPPSERSPLTAKQRGGLGARSSASALSAGAGGGLSGRTASTPMAAVPGKGRGAASSGAIELQVSDGVDAGAVRTRLNPGAGLATRNGVVCGGPPTTSGVAAAGAEECRGARVRSGAAALSVGAGDARSGRASSAGGGRRGERRRGAAPRSTVGIPAPDGADHLAERARSDRGLAAWSGTAPAGPSTALPTCPNRPPAIERTRSGGVRWAGDPARPGMSTPPVHRLIARSGACAASRRWPGTKGRSEAGGIRWPEASGAEGVVSGAARLRAVAAAPSGGERRGEDVRDGG
ncbi:hypothetical protein CLV72_105114 [Allonocardiopsis opalescens]|uniref:Uncharacterized protein n=1 Tax=Allonocardiopsis opalescens TaxID=1144618 RepID=A0A2T0Q1T7_9ACTN|nr:hypothetical protein CLV72_105114 [Allonocardiopsis opalescens]